MILPDTFEETKESGDSSPNRTGRASSQSEALKKYGHRHSFQIKDSRFVVDKFYIPKKALGSGAYGVVCSCIDERTGEKVALKMIPDIMSELTQAKNVLREIKLMRHLNHPNIINLLDIVNPLSRKDFDNVHLAMELMDSDLHRVIHSKNQLTEDHFSYFLYQLLCALKYMHSANVVHRDLKPSNLLISADCDLKVCDFGLARGVSSEEIEMDNLTEYVVTRWYRAPEIMCCCQEYGPPVDVWAAGCILAEMISKRPLLPGDSYIHQLNLIFGLLGTPEPQELYWMSNARACEYISGLPKQEKIPFRKIFPKESCSDNCLDLLGKMLVFNPEERISVDEALEHPFFERVRRVELETVCPDRFDYSWESQVFSTREVRWFFFDEMCQFRPEARAINPLESFQGVNILPKATH